MKNPSGGESPVDPMAALKADLFSLHSLAGQNVTYVADSGETRKYWPNRFLQALKRAVEGGNAEVLGYVRRMVMSDDPSRGFGYLEAAGRLDLTVEALVADPAKPYHHLFGEEMVEAAVQRLAEYGHTVAGTQGAPSPGVLAAEAVTETVDGFAVELIVEVARSGEVTVTSGEAVVPVDGVLGAVSAFTGVLSQAHAAATAGA